MSYLKKSLLARLVVYFMLLSLVTVSLIVATAFLQARTALQDAAFDRLRVAATLKEDALTQWIDDQRQDLLLMAEFTAVQDQVRTLLRYPPDDPVYQAAYRGLRETLTAVNAGKAAWQEMLILSDQGQVTLSTDSTHEGETRALDRFFTQGQIRTFVQKAYLLPETFQPTITIATPLPQQTERLPGVLAIHLNLERMDSIILERTGLGTGSESYLVDSYNVFLSSQRFGSAEFPRGVHSEGINAALQKRNGSGLYANYKGVSVIGVYRWLDELEVALVVEMPENVALAPARRLALAILLVGLSLAVVLTGGMYLLARQIARPILSITDTALQVADGDLSSTAPVITEDEIGVLARTFNDMTARLRVLYEDLDQEITERKQIELALRDSEERYRSFVAQSTEGIWRSEVDYPFSINLPEDQQVDQLLRHGYLAECNDAYAQMYGYDKANDIIGSRTADFLSADNAEHMAFLRAFIQGGYRTFDAESIETDRHGNVRYFSNSLIGIIEDGMYLRAWGTQRDITERKRAQHALQASEERYRDLFEDAPVMYVITRNQNNTPIIADCNQLFLDTIGYRREEVLEQPLSAFYTPHSQTQMHEEGGYLRALKGEFRTEERQLQARDRRVIETLLHAVPEINVAGRVWGTRAMFVDITERKLAQQERERLIEDLEAKNAELERFTYTVSHDLKSPLVTIKGFLGLLKRDIAKGDADRMTRDIQQIQDAAEKMQRLLGELLELSRIGRLVNPPETISISDLAREAVEMVSGRIVARGVEVNIEPAMPLVSVDRVRMFEVYQNLVDNAVKFMGDQREPCIEIGTRRDGNTVVFFVRDNGVGIAPKYHDKVFGLFDRLDPGSEGTGIGLALVKRIVEVHGGAIWVESEGLGNGSTFCFTLPLVEDEARTVS